MKTITLEFPDSVDLPFASSSQEFARALRVAAAIHWYDRGLISQSKGAEISGLSRAGFIDALAAAKVDAFQITDAELAEEVERGLEAHRERLSVDLPEPAGIARHLE